MQANQLTGFEPGFAKLFELGQQVIVVFGFGQEKQLHQCLQPLTPLLRQRRLREFLVGNFQCIQQSHERADQYRIQTANFIIRLNAVAGFGATDGITEQHAAQAKTPTVLFQV